MAPLSLGLERGHLESGGSGGRQDTCLPGEIHDGLQGKVGVCFALFSCIVFFILFGRIGD